MVRSFFHLPIRSWSPTNIVSLVKILRTEANDLFYCHRQYFRKMHLLIIIFSLRLIWVSMPITITVWCVLSFILQFYFKRMFYDYYFCKHLQLQKQVMQHVTCSWICCLPRKRSNLNFHSLYWGNIIRKYALSRLIVHNKLDLYANRTYVIAFYTLPIHNLCMDLDLLTSVNSRILQNKHI